jgi:hypothetical protein
MCFSDKVNLNKGFVIVDIFACSRDYNVYSKTVNKLVFQTLHFRKKKWSAGYDNSYRTYSKHGIVITKSIMNLRADIRDYIVMHI